MGEPITRGLRRSQASTFTAASRTRTTPPGPVVLLLSPDLEVRAQTQQTREYLRLLVPPDSDQDPIPAGAYNVGAQLLAREMAVDAQPPLARVHVADGMWLTLGAARMDAKAEDQSDIAVSIEITSAADRLGVFSRAYALTERENELLLLLAAGADTRTAGSAMFVSEHTVQDYLKAIFSKTGSHSRRTLLARTLGR